MGRLRPAREDFARSLRRTLLLVRERRAGLHGCEPFSIFRLSDGEVVIVGGFNFNDAGASANAELFDPASVVPVPFSLTDATRLSGVAFRFAFNNTPGLNFSVLRAPDPTMVTLKPVGLRYEGFFEGVGGNKVRNPWCYWCF